MIKEDINVCNEICLFLYSFNNANLVDSIPQELLTYFYNNSSVNKDLIVDIDTFDFSDEATDIIAYLSYTYFFNNEEKSRADKIFIHNERILAKKN